jgi:hypothetical protein
MTLIGQNLKKHLWENRILLILSSDINSDVFNSQIKTIKENSEGLDERKLVVYKVVPEDYELVHKNNSWINDTKIFNTYKRTKKVFEVVLIGLDGGVKLRQTKYLSPEKLFAIIDGMPMRRSEIKSKNKN